MSESAAQNSHSHIAFAASAAAPPPGEIAQESEAILRSFYDSAPMVMGVVEIRNNDIMLLSGNTAAANIMGLTPETVKFQMVSELGLPPERIQEWIDRYRIAERAQSPARFEYRSPTPDGMRWMAATVSFIDYSEEGHARCSYIIEDIHAAKQAQLDQQFLGSLDAKIRRIAVPEKIFASAAQATGQYLDVFRAHFDDIHRDTDAFIVHENYTRDTFSIAGAHALSAFGPPQLLAGLQAGQPLVIADVTLDARTAAAYESAYRPLSVRAFAAVPYMRAGKWVGAFVAESDTPRQWKEEEIALLETVTQRVWPVVEAARMAQAAQKEIAERQRAEAALQESRDYYRTLTEAVPQLVWTTGPDGVADYFNPQWYLYTGQTIDETARRGRGNIHPDDLPHTMERWQAAVRTGQAYEVEYRLKRADGEYRWFLVRGVPLKNAQGEIYKWFGTCTDIHDQKRAELEIAALNNRLRRSVQETHHRVKNNLQIISALVELQVEEAQTSVPLSAMTRIGQHARSLATLHDLLTQEVRVGGEADHIHTKAALNKLLPLLQATTGGRRIRYQVDDFSLPVREGASLALLISELVSNAVKHGRDAIEVTLTVEAQTACLEVSDDGPGFPPGFDWQKAAHTGLGLIDSTGRHDLRGEIAYANRPEGGARVIVRFPLPDGTPEQS